MLARASLLASRAHLGFGLYDAALPAFDDTAKLAVLERLASARDASFHSFQQRWVAESDGEPAGSISAFETGETADAALGQAVLAAVDPALLPGVAAARATFGLAALPHPSGAWAIELVATFPEHRGKGVATALLAAVLEEGRRRRLNVASVTYEIGNEPAAAAYTGSGFRVAAECRHPEFQALFRCPGTARAERALHPEA